VRSEFLNALNCAARVMVMTGKKVSIDDFLPKFDLTKEQREKEAQDRMVAAFAANCISGE
jgi:hypothetical protein